jgi:hypothetical protein
MTKDIRVEEFYDTVQIYDKYGGFGSIELTKSEAEFVKEQLEEILEDRE